MSGRLTRSGFRNRSKRSLYGIGSTSVIRRAYATRLPAALPRPGPTGIPRSFAYPMKSETMRKYPEKPVFSMTESSNSSRRRYSSSRSRGIPSPRVFRSDSRRSSPFDACSRRYASEETPGGRANSGNLVTPSSIFTRHRSAMARVLSRASGATWPKALSNSSRDFT